MNVTELRAGARVQWRVWTGETASATVVSWSSQGILLRSDDGHDVYHPTGLVYDLAGLVREFEVVS